MHATPPRVALVPNAIVFHDPRNGLAGTGWTSCANSAFGCRPQGTISLTTDGGRTWRVVLRTPRPVVSLSSSSGADWARYDNGVTFRSDDGGRTWRRSAPPSAPVPPCGGGDLSPTDQVVVTPSGRRWALCVTSAGAGAEGKSVYQLRSGRWRRIALTPFAPPGRIQGGLSIAGYPVGMAMADDGFGLIWESRGTLYVTRDGGAHWIGQPRVAVPEVDFGESGAALPGGVGFVLLAHNGGTEVRRLFETRDAGRTWQLVHQWN